MHRLVVLTLLCSSACAPRAARNEGHRPVPEKEIADALSKLYATDHLPVGENLVRVEVHSVEGLEDTYVAVYDWRDHWWGGFTCFNFRNGQIAWEAGQKSPPEEQSIFSIESFRLKGFEEPFVAVIGDTHIGHGDYYLYQLHGTELMLLLRTFVRDQHRDETLIRGPHLDVEFKDLNGDGCDDATFSGIVEEYSDDPAIESPLRSYPCKKVFLWSPAAGRFVEDPDQRKGFEAYAGRK